MNRKIVAAAALLAGALLFTACTGSKPAGGPAGTWYEQAENGCLLEILDREILYTSHDGKYTSSVSYTYDGAGDQPELVLGDFFYFEDIYYSKEEDRIIAYTLSHTDGDGGHHRVEFARTQYVAPPAPVYAPAEDHSDPDAKKEFPDLTIRSMQVSFYDEGEPYDVNSSMAQQPPFPGDYSYGLHVLEDGSGTVSSSYCQEIRIAKEIVDELQELARAEDLGTINGLDIHTPDVPYGSPEYTAEIELASGDILRSSANWTDVPENWARFQYRMHRLLFQAFADAGYNIYSGDFHSTEPMKRVQGPEVLRRDASGITEEEIRIVPDWQKAYEYSLDTQYFVFSDPENRYPALMKTLGALSRQYKKTAEETLRKHYEVMEAVPKSVWTKADRKYCYSLYAVDHWSLSRNIFSFTVSEGEAGSLGVGDFGHGKYRYTRFNIDAETGAILSLSDLFTSPDAVYDVLMERFSHYGTHNDSGKFVHSDAFPAFLREAVRKPEPEGIGWNTGYDSLELWMPLGMYEGNDSQLREVLYYDEIQDILGEKYTSVW